MSLGSHNIKLCTLPTQRMYLFCLILTINSGHSSEQLQLLVLCYKSAVTEELNFEVLVSRKSCFLQWFTKLTIQHETKTFFTSTKVSEHCSGPEQFPCWKRMCQAIGLVSRPYSLSCVCSVRQELSL
jgi:hypothetical protein